MESLVQDIRYALRLFAKAPAFAAIVILLIAAGVSTNTLIFSAIDTLLLTPLPVAHPEQIVALAATSNLNWPRNQFDYATYEGVRAKFKSFSGVFAQTDLDVAMRGSGAAERVAAQFVSGNYFSSLGVRTKLGRTLNEGDDRSTIGSWPVVLSYGFWQRRFGGASTAVGQSLLLQDLPAVVVGVLPREFHGIEIDTSPDIRIPLAALPLITHIPLKDARLFDYLEVAGRLRPGVSLPTATAEWNTLLPALNETIGAQRSGMSDQEKKDLLQDRARVESMATGASALRKQFSRALLLLMGGVGLLLLIVCANVASLLLARASARQKEIAMRLALGASSSRLLRQLLTESLLLAVIGGALGFGIAYGCAPLLVRALPASHIPSAVSIHPDFRVCAFTLSICLLTGIVFGVAPAFQAGRLDLNLAIKAGPRARQGLRTGSLLVGAQVALCAVLLVGAALLLRTLHNLKSADTGFNRDRIAFFTIDPGMAHYTTEQTRSLRDRLKATVERLPGVRSVSYSDVALMKGIGIKTTVAPAGQEARRSEFLNTSLNSVSPEYFDTMGIPLLAGRRIAAGDSRDVKPGPVVVNEAFVRRFFPNQNPLGKRFGMGLRGPAKAEQVIVGVVGDSKYRSLREESPPTFYTAINASMREVGDFVVHVRTASDPRAVLPEIRRVLAGIDSRLPMFDAKTMEQAVENTLWQEKLVAALASIFGFLAAVLAGMGLFGVLSYSVAQRTREFGVRMALGARPEHILRVVFVRVLWVIGIGLAAGFAVYYPVSRLLGNLLYRVRPLDPLSLAGAAAFLLVTATLAGWWPARRATLVDPAVALREQ